MGTRRVSGPPHYPAGPVDSELTTTTIEDVELDDGELEGNEASRRAPRPGRCPRMAVDAAARALPDAAVDAAAAARALAAIADAAAAPWPPPASGVVEMVAAWVGG
ncbi:hypothetical protein OsJ_18715 [Oryza sativa Japonica Group]|uniref:Uncharacterized protein n=1 Tax=Oryza sativa subsp. japonica TaxID=39947 RepID=B9FPU8_ORYSJ|nr:hypothetical protein OsJ_18715 [Oryza sativa Japonica Group]